MGALIEERPWQALVDRFVCQKVRAVLNPFFLDLGRVLKEISPVPTVRVTESTKLILLSMAKGAAIQAFDEQMARVIAAGSEQNKPPAESSICGND